MKETFVAVSVLIGFAGMLPYCLDCARSVARPHAVSWFVWSILAFTVFAYTRDHGETWATLFIVVQACMSLGIAVFALARYGTSHVRRFDWVCLALALTGLSVYALWHDFLVSATIACATNLLGFLPTFRKSWADPMHETLSPYISGMAAWGFTVAALSNYSLATVAYPAVIMSANLALCVLVLLRRRQYTQVGEHA